jgi:ParB-like chromosome segregation protein Spo0J
VSGPEVLNLEPEVGELKIHPLCSVFPDMAPNEYEDLKDSIKVNGLLHPIVTYEEAILDGKNRDRACRELGIEPRTEPYQGDDLFGFVVAKNLTRRNLTTSQRSIIAGKIANMRQGERTDLEPSANLQKVSQAQAAEMLNVSPRTVVDAAYVLDHGTPDLVSAVERGDMKTSAAKAIANLPPEEQQRIVEEKDPGARRAAIKAAKKSAATKQKTTKATTEPPVTKKNTVKVPSNEQPAPKKFKPGSRPWFKERVANLWDVVRDLREAVPELQGTLYSQQDHNLFRSIVAAQEALGHVVRIATNPVEVKKVSIAFVKLWNQQKGEQLEGKYCSESLMSKVNEAVACACELDLDRWARVVETIAGKDPSWFTRDNFNDLISTRGGRPDGLEKLEEQEGLPTWGGATPEAPGDPAESEP